MNEKIKKIAKTAKEEARRFYNNHEEGCNTALGVATVVAVFASGYYLGDTVVRYNQRMSETMVILKHPEEGKAWVEACKETAEAVDRIYKK